MNPNTIAVLAHEFRLRLVGRYRTWGELELEGRPQDLRWLSEHLLDQESLTIVLYIPYDSPSPYQGFLNTLEIRQTNGTLQVERRGTSLFLTGGKPTLEIIRNNLSFLAAQVEESGEPEHMHIEYFPEHYYLSPTSEPLVIAAEKP